MSRRRSCVVCDQTPQTESTGEYAGSASAFRAGSLSPSPGRRDKSSVDGATPWPRKTRAAIVRARQQVEPAHREVQGRGTRRVEDRERRGAKR
jgi:hypothetical protein